MTSETSAPTRLEDYRPTTYSVSTVDLDIQLSPNATTVVSRLHLALREPSNAGAPLELAGDELKLTGIKLNGVELSPTEYEASSDVLVISSAPAEPFELEISTQIDPEANTQLMGLYRSSGAYCTQCEAEGFRRITYFLDRPDVLAVYTTRIEADKKSSPVLLGNGNLIETGDVGASGRHFAVWRDPHPKPSYLFAMVAGDLACVSEKYVTQSGRPVDLNIYVEHGKEERCGWAMDSLKRSMRWDEEVFGREYDLDVFNIVAVSDFNMGAMENKGLNIFNDKYVLADPETATDQDYALIEAIIAHEYFHNWTGNRITCRDWFQLCLKEGLTVFRDQEFSSDMRSRPVKRISDVKRLKSQQFSEDAGPLAHPVRPRQYHQINNFYTATVYEKGAEVIRMLKSLLGEENFRSGMDLYFQRHDGDATTIEAFLTCFSDASGADLDQFALWYEQAGTPSLDVKSHYDEKRETLTLELRQVVPATPGQANKQPHVIPIRLGLVGPDGADMPINSDENTHGDLIILKESSKTLHLTGVKSKPTLSLLRGFSAPVTLNSDVTRADLAFLAQNDPDPYNRWQSLQTLSLNILAAAATRITEGHTPSDQDDDDGENTICALLKALQTTANDDALDPAYKALALQLPTEADVAREIGANVNPEAIARAHLALRRRAAKALRSSANQISGDMDPGAPYSPDAGPAGRRALRNILLDYRAYTGDDEDAKLVEESFAKANNMTDRLAAVTSLTHAGLPQAQDALAAFFTRHQNDALTLDKWFSIQATSPQDDTLEKIQLLTKHPAFSYNNPNRLRALIGAFAMGNQAQFNRADGAGYAFVADVVLSLNKRNPQVAARLLSAFRSWRTLESNRANKAKAELERIASQKDLSSDVRDIVDRCLG